MRVNDLKVQGIAREVGMLYMVGTKEYSRPVKVGDLTMEFEFEGSDNEAYIEVYQAGKSRALESYSNEFEDIRIDFPQFFQD
jgi:hypothetical protein